MLGAASPTLLGISLDTGPFGMTPKQSLTSSVYGESRTTIMSHMTAIPKFHHYQAIREGVCVPGV